MTRRRRDTRIRHVDGWGGDGILESALYNIDFVI